MSFDFKSVERARRQTSRTTLSRRESAKLPFITAAVGGGGLLLDTCVYIDQMQGKAPGLIEDLLTARTVNHSTIAIQELMHSVGALDPKDPRSRRAVAAIEKAITGMPSHRTFIPDTEILANAAVCSGILCRTQGYAKDNRMSALHDCVLFFQALKLGFSVLTRNVQDFDLLLQLQPRGRVLFYRLSDQGTIP